MWALQNAVQRSGRHVRVLARWASATTGTPAAAAAAAEETKSGYSSAALLVAALTFLGGYIWHSRQGNVAHDALVDKLAAEAVLCPSEITALRSENKISVPEFRKVVARCRAYFPSGTATFSQFAWVVWDTLQATHPGGIKNHHNLERAAVAMQQAYEDAFFAAAKAAGQIPPQTSGETGGDDSAAAAAPPVEAPVRVSSHAGDNPQPLPVLQLLTLFSVVVAGPAQDRVDLLFDLVADSHPALQCHTVADIAQRALQAAQVGEAEGPGSGSEWQDPPELPEVLQEEQLLQLIQSVRDTFQLPARQCVVEHQRWPLPQWRTKTPADHLASALEDRKIKREDCQGGFDRDTVEDLLFSKGVCLWAECYNEVR